MDDRPVEADIDRWRRRLGGISFVIVCFLPPLLLGLAASANSLVWNAGAWMVDYGAALSGLPGLAAVMLLAPLASYRRRDALMLLVPGLNVYLAWVIGARVAELSLGQAAISDGRAVYPPIQAGQP